MADSPKQRSASRVENLVLGELDVTLLSDQSLRDELLRHGLDAGPVVGEWTRICPRKKSKLNRIRIVTPPTPLLVSTSGHGGGG